MVLLAQRQRGVFSTVRAWAGHAKQPPRTRDDPDWELGTRLRETSKTIVKALAMLRDQGRAEEIGFAGLLLECALQRYPRGEHASDNTVRKVPSTDELGLLSECWETV